MILSRGEILERIMKEKLVEGFVDLKHQLQPASFDLTLAKVYSIESRAKIDFDNSQRVLSEAKEIPFEKDWVSLNKGDYKIQFNEIVRLPAGIAGLGINRSSLSRSGCVVHTGWWDPGYHGRGEALLSVGGKGIELKKNAKVAQLVFFNLGEGAEELYAGIHHRENI